MSPRPSVLNPGFRFLTKSIRASVLITLTLSLSCATSPTGRSQLILLPDSQLDQMGVASFAEMKKTVPIETSTRENAYVKCIVDALLNANRDQVGDRSWEVVVFRSKDVNAFAVPGGKIGVYTGILDVAKTADQLSAVLGHEVGHVIARHGNERVSAGLGAQLGLMTAGELFKNSSSREAIMAGLGLGAQFGVLLPHSRAHETESDYIGQKMMAKAGFDPRESVQLWKNMAAASGGGAPPEWMSTHPANSTRIAQLESNMPEAINLYNQAVAQGRNPKCVRK
jgi:predicted Zn-dependent protease